jgi:hypothetical protein
MAHESWPFQDRALHHIHSLLRRLTPKVQALLDFLDEYIGTDRDPKLKNDLAKGYFTDRTLAPISGP